MQRCIELARLGEGRVAPNPMVGAVLVYDGRIIGEGWHQVYGGPHAEVNCVNSVQPADEALISQSTLYVSLEPCAHYGKTPPCSLLILHKGIRKVVVGCRDPFKAVNGKGIEQLREAGVEVMVGVLEKECQYLNKRFFYFHQHQSPYIILKWAQTANGFIGSGSHERLMISGEATNRLVHQWRAAEAAILVGSRTALLDNPSLTNRYWPGSSPLRMVIDRQAQLPQQLQLFTDGNPTIVLNTVTDKQEGQVRFIQLRPDDALLPQVLSFAYEQHLLSILVEGGALLLKQFIDLGYWNEIRCITNTQLHITHGVAAPALPQGINNREFRLDNDLIQITHNPSIL
jgi:diaminohydroxyphosphoribosylaminopyrimidine deaminase/5-amino-6-(5-phosphoribosylamino)uracil reductase